MLELWKESYFDVRAKIEASGRDARWEFDRKRLFERTDYMASICNDLHKVAQVSFYFFSFLICLEINFWTIWQPSGAHSAVGRLPVVAHSSFWWMETRKSVVELHPYNCLRPLGSCPVLSSNHFG